MSDKTTEERVEEFKLELGKRISGYSSAKDVASFDMKWVGDTLLQLIQEEREKAVDYTLHIFCMMGHITDSDAKAFKKSFYLKESNPREEK